MEVAAGGGIGRIGHIALQHNRLAAVPGVRLGHRGQQRLGVGMLGIREQRFGARVLHQHAHVHDCNAIADVLHHAQVVGDEQVGQAVLFLQVLQEVQNLGLHGHVEGGDRLVEDDQLRIQRQGPGDADALPLAAAEGVGIAVQVLRPQSHHAQQIGHPFLQFGAGGHAVDQ